MPDETRPPASRLQNAIAIFSLTLIGLSVIAIIVLIIIGHAGMTKPTALQLFVSDFPLLGLPLGALGIIALFVVGVVQRRKLNNPRGTK